MIDKIPRRTAGGVSLSLSLSLSLPVCLYPSLLPHIGYRTHKVKLGVRGRISDSLNFLTSNRTQGKAPGLLLAFGEGDPIAIWTPEIFDQGRWERGDIILGRGG